LQKILWKSFYGIYVTPIRLTLFAVSVFLCLSSSWLEVSSCFCLEMIYLEGVMNTFIENIVRKFNSNILDLRVIIWINISQRKGELPAFYKVEKTRTVTFTNVARNSRKLRYSFTSTTVHFKDSKKIFSHFYSNSNISEIQFTEARPRCWAIWIISRLQFVVQYRILPWNYF